MPVRDVFDLIDTLVKPIVLFNSEIWGININKELEQFHLSFMKRILGVKKSTNNCLIYTKTGRYPLYIICIYIRIVKYWFKISTASEHRYNYLHYFNKCPSSWSLFVRKILYEYGFGYVWEANAVGIHHPDFIKQYEQRLKDTFQQKCRSEIANRNRCSLYNHLYREFTMANYLNKVQNEQTGEL